ncbi:hypothetical protein [Rhizobium sp. BK399]|uniref:hypothetical protein n=1 Tax=Rhizobium sp. BK399 TaxID=2587063 RepID=UPI001616CB80|nr:hypothetical protein [Rhizobium sp. BK399]MBB3545255.1 hypothetical protein [Rhizobium sp. BK399]
MNKEGAGYRRTRKDTGGERRLSTQSDGFGFAISDSVLDFFVRRRQKDAEILGDLVRSLEYNDALDGAGDFVLVAGDYASEASKMLLIGSNFAPQAANRIR